MEHTFLWNSPVPDLVIVTVRKFNDWDRNLKLQKLESGKFFVKVKLPWGQKVQYKYIVDDQWRINDNEEVENDTEGNQNNVLHVPTEAAYLKQQAEEKEKKLQEAKQTEEEKQAPDFVGDLAAGVGGVAMAAAAATVAGVSGAATQATEAIQHVLHPDQGEENKEDVSDATKANLTSAPINHIETHSVATVPGEAPADPAPSRSPEAQPEQNHSVSTVPSDEKIAAATGALSEKPISNSSIALNPPPMPTSEEIGRLMPNPSLVTERPASPGLGSRAKEAVLGAGVGVTAGAAGVAAAVKSEGSKAKETVKEKVESTPEKVTSVDGRPNSFGAPPIAASPVKKAEAETKTVDPALEPQTQQAQATSGTVTDAKPIAPSAASTEPPTTPKKSTTESKQETPITPANKKETPTNKVQQEQGTATSAKSTPGDFATAPTTPQGTPSKVVTKRKSGFFNKIKSAFSHKEKS